MSTCSYCGIYVRFLVLGEIEEMDGKKIWSPPLSPVESKAKPVTKGLAPFAQPTEYLLTERYEVHDCEQGKVAQADREQRYAQTLEQRRRTQDAWVEALKRTCPKCHAVRRARCLNLSDVRYGKEPREVSWPHAERLPEDWFAQQDPG